ncbi:hypothetical protein [Phytoactinopolyspora limicola]|uniref:hypothetical protein n=1 Tax=Phytoactinopolyspora limicola TaxID=2715536 RepID=UPI00140B3AAC|nr:hypothetical protein [Phytoactinopolyspora limicola]
MSVHVIGRRRRLVAGAMVMAAGLAGMVGCTSDGDQRGQIGRALETAGENTAAELIDDEEAEVNPREASFLSEWELIHVIAWQVSHPPHLYVAHRDAAEAAVVSRSEEAFDAMVAADGTGVPDADVATDLAITRAEVTRPQYRVVYVVESVDDIKFRDGLEPDEEEHRQEVLDRFGGQITAPEVEAGPDGDWLVTFYVIDAEVEGLDHRLERREVTIGADGAVIDEGVDVLAENLPLLFYMR